MELCLGTIVHLRCYVSFFLLFCRCSVLVFIMLNEINKELLSFIQTREKDAYLLGDYNIDLLKYHTHKLTSNFVEITASHHFLPIITRPTRITSSSATLIDNLFTNNIKKISHQVILIDDISDHL